MPLRARQDFELQDEGLQVLAMVIIVYDLSFLIIGTFVFYGVLMSYVRACSRPRMRAGLWRQAARALTRAFVAPAGSGAGAAG